MGRILAMSLGILVLALGAGLYVYEQRAEVCDVCYREMHHPAFYRVELETGESKDLCCPRCGLRYQHRRDDVERTLVRDYWSGEMMPASRATFVEASSVFTCDHSAAVQEDRTGSQYQLSWDRCLPSLVAFENPEAATAFRQTNGGAIRTYEELLQEGF